MEISCARPVAAAAETTDATCLNGSVGSARARISTTDQESSWRKRSLSKSEDTSGGVRTAANDAALPPDGVACALWKYWRRTRGVANDTKPKPWFFWRPRDADFERAFSIAAARIATGLRRIAVFYGGMPRSNGVSTTFPRPVHAAASRTIEQRDIRCRLESVLGREHRWREQRGEEFRLNSVFVKRKTTKLRTFIIFKFGQHRKVAVYPSVCMMRSSYRATALYRI